MTGANLKKWDDKIHEMGHHMEDLERDFVT